MVNQGGERQTEDGCDRNAAKYVSTNSDTTGLVGNKSVQSPVILRMSALSSAGGHRFHRQSDQTVVGGP